MIDTNKPITKISYNGDLMYLYEGKVESSNDLFNQYMNYTLTHITEEDLQGATTLRASLFANQSNLISVEIPDTVTSMGDKVFSNCTKLVHIKLSKNCQAITNQPFERCSSLTTLELPEGVTSTSGLLTQNCTQLKHIHLPTTLKSTGDGIGAYLSSGYPNVYIKDLKSYALIKTGQGYWLGIGKEYYLYLNGELITDLVLPADTVIEAQIFNKCQIKTANLGNVATIPSKAFSNIKTLTSVIIGENIQLIQAEAFSGCTALTEIILDKSCTTADDIPTLSNANAIPSTAYIYVPDSITQALYQSATNWSSIASKVKLINELQ